MERQDFTDKERKKERVTEGKTGLPDRRARRAAADTPARGCYFKTQGIYKGDTEF